MKGAGDNSYNNTLSSELTKKSTSKSVFHRMPCSSFLAARSLILQNSYVYYGGAAGDMTIVLKYYTVILPASAKYPT